MRHHVAEGIQLTGNGLSRRAFWGGGMSASNAKGVVHLTAEDVARVINGQPTAGIVI